MYALVKAHFGGDIRLDLLYLLLVPVEQLEEGRLRSGRALRAEQLQRRRDIIKILKVKRQLIQPESRALADRRQLRRLEMSVSERRHSLVLKREIAQVLHDGKELRADEL